MIFLSALFLVTATGFIALSYEILWFRVYSFVSEGTGEIFAMFLGFYLIGIAFGAFFSRKYCESLKDDGYRTSAAALFLFLLIGNVAAFLAIPAMAWLVHFVNYRYTFPIVIFGAGLLGASFPLISHVGILQPGEVGPRLSYLYVGNIIGAAAGSLVTGFILMQYYGIATIAICLTVLGLVLSLLVLFYSSGRAAFLKASGIVLLLIFVIAIGPKLYLHTYEKLLLKRDYRPHLQFAHLIENRYGVTAVSPKGTLFGGGVYDGVYSLDLRNDRNGIIRPFALGAVKKSFEEVLMVGLGSGSWTAVVARDPRVRHITVVEINPAYIDLLKYYPDHSEMLRDPRVEFVIDDARRWLRRNPDRRFDAIISNTTWSWRMHATNLLSVEFMELIRSHLKKNGIFYYNTTGSLRALRTGAIVFPYAVRFENCLAVSDLPITFEFSRLKALLDSYKINGHSLFDLSLESDRNKIEEIVQNCPEHTEDRESILARTSGLRVITDDNMGTEWNREPFLYNAMK